MTVCDTCSGPLDQLAELMVHGCHRCRKCGLVVCLPLPSDRDVAAVYDGTDYFTRRGDDAPATLAAKVAAAQPLARKIRRQLPANARVFEVGAATGALVKALRDNGLQASGLELSSYAVLVARERLGVDLVQGAIEAMDLGEGIDGIVAMHVVEHLRSPRAFIQKAASALRDGGLLLVEVPDFGARMRTQMGADWPYFRPGEHLYHFTEHSLGVLLGSSGLDVHRVERVGGLGVLQPGTGRDGVAAANASPRLTGWRATVYNSRGVVYRLPLTRQAARWVNHRLGYDVLRRNAHIRLWATKRLP